jgi:hypothetical protein
MSQPEDFGYIFPKDGVVSLKDVDKIVSAICKRPESKPEIVKALWGCALECAGEREPGLACAYFEKVLLLVDTPEEKAQVFLTMGQACLASQRGITANWMSLRILCKGTSREFLLPSSV